MESFQDLEITRYCTFQLPAQTPYENLQYAVLGTSHSSNDVIANQCNCSIDMTLHEYLAFGCLRSGARLQWLNIARELRASVLNFHKEAVGALLMQAAWQIGDLNGLDDWEWHLDLSQPEFGKVLVRELKVFLLTFEANWLMVISLRSAIVLTARLLASATDSNVIAEGYSLLRDARRIAFDWMHQLATKLETILDESETQEFQVRLCELAATCRSTFDVDPKHAPFLLESQDDVAVLVECSITVFRNTPKSVSTGRLKVILDRDRRLSHSLEPLLRQRIHEHPEGLNSAVSAVWTAYRPGCPWTHLESPNNRWITTRANGEAGQTSLDVHLNLLEGRLLVNGVPLDRLPDDYTMDKDNIYFRIFGRVCQNKTLVVHAIFMMDSRKCWMSLLPMFLG